MYSIFEQLLQRDGISAYKFCKDTGVTQSCVSNWKKRKTKISYEYAKIIADYFNVSPEYVMGEETPTRDGYYLNDETAQMAQEMFDNKDLRVLFDAARDASPEDLQTVRTMLLALKKKEQ